MAAKLMLLFCAQALFVQIVLSQCTSRASVAIDSGYLGAGIYGLDSPYGYDAPILSAPYRFADPINSEPFGLADPWALPPLEFSPTTGGALPVASNSAIPPTGISVKSDNIFEGTISVVGELPFVGTVAMDGSLPTVGSGLISHACGNGMNAIVSEINAFAPGNAGPYSPGPYSPSAYCPGPYSPSLAVPFLGYRPDWTDRGCGSAW